MNGGYAERIERLVGLRRARAAIDAEEQRLLHELATTPAPELGPDALAKEWVREDVACALRINPQVAAGLLSDAVALVEHHPRILALLEAGEISARHVQRLLDALAPLPHDVASAVEERVLQKAPSQTPGQFAAAVRRAVLALDPRDQDQQHRDAVAARRVCFSPRDDGTTELWALLSTEVAAALKAAIDQHADELKGSDDRTADQRRADALAELALGADEPTRPRVNVTVALSTLLDLDAQSGELDGLGPIPAALARALAFDPTGTWRRLLTDEHGQVVDAGRTSYRPPAPLARLVTAQHPTCCFPGCTRSAQRAELDHILAWAAGGETNADNLHPLCPRHHHVKHEAGWRTWRLPDGTTRWRSPSGHTYDRPPDHPPRDGTTTQAA